MLKRGFTRLNPAKRNPALRRGAGYLTGFTLIETIIAILVVTIGVSAAYIATQKIISYTYQISSRLTAAYLAKEGIEIVRNIRDTNWLQDAQPDPAQPEGWADGLAGGSGEWEADYTTVTFTGNGSYENCGGTPGYNCKGYNTDHYLKIAGGFYNYTSGNLTKFKRKITITGGGGNPLEVSVEVRWIEKGKTYGPITAQEVLYNWY